MAIRQLAVESGPWLGRFAAASLLAVSALAGCAGKFVQAAADDQDSSDGGALGASGSAGTPSGSGGSGGSGGEARDSAVPDSDPRDVGVDVATEPPIPLEGLMLWLRADVGITLAGDAVTLWADQSGSSADATQTEPDEQPRFVSGGIAGRPVIEFDGVDDFMTLADGFADFTRGVSMFAVVLQEPTGDCVAVVQLSNGIEIDDITLGQFNGQLLYEVADEYYSGDDLPVGSPQLLAALHRPDGAFVLRRNGRPAGEGTMMLPAVVEREQNYVGDSIYDGCVEFPGQMAEILVYSRAVTDVELLRIEAYLRNRAGCCEN